MSTKQSIVKMAMAALLMAAPLAHASMEGNPLDPSYYVGHPSNQSAPEAGTPYVDTRNPLNPAYQNPSDATGGKWQGASNKDTDVGLDLTNPLHPTYRFR
jgi:hypothetical protein